MNASFNPLRFSPLVEKVRLALPQGAPIYLVGGAVRDMLIGRFSHDLDFAIPQKAIPTSRRLAKSLGADFFPLDPERDTGRIILTDDDGQRTFLDFSAYRGPDLESDLRDRDFTVNAMAIPMHGDPVLIDPLGGSKDLREKLLRACSDRAFLNDPVRTVRAVRLGVALGFKLIPETRQLLHQAIPELGRVSPERLRDELFRILEGRTPASALRTLDLLGALEFLLPELSLLKGVSQSAPHTSDVFEHTLNSAQRMAEVLDVLSPQPKPDSADNWAMGLISLRLGRYRPQLHQHLATPLNLDRSLRALLVLAALYHDIGKPQTRQVDENYRIRFLEHETAGTSIATQRAAHLHLSNQETSRLATLIRNHMRPLLLAHNKDLPSRKAVYHYFRDCGEAGVDICLLALADALGTYGVSLPQDEWARLVEVVRILLEAWWEKQAEHVSPPTLLSGSDLIQELGLHPGPQVGKLLEAIREAQAIGEVQTREQALEVARRYLQ